MRFFKKGKFNVLDFSSLRFFSNYHALLKNIIRVIEGSSYRG